MKRYLFLLGFSAFISFFSGGVYVVSERYIPSPTEEYIDKPEIDYGRIFSEQELDAATELMERKLAQKKWERANRTVNSERGLSVLLGLVPWLFLVPWVAAKYKEVLVLLSVPLVGALIGIVSYSFIVGLLLYSFIAVYMRPIVCRKMGSG